MTEPMETTAEERERWAHLPRGEVEPALKASSLERLLRDFDRLSSRTSGEEMREACAIAAGAAVKKLYVEGGSISWNDAVLTAFVDAENAVRALPLAPPGTEPATQTGESVGGIDVPPADLRASLSASGTSPGLSPPVPADEPGRAIAREILDAFGAEDDSWSIERESPNGDFLSLDFSGSDEQPVYLYWRPKGKPSVGFELTRSSAPSPAIGKAP